MATHPPSRSVPPIVVCCGHACLDVIPTMHRDEIPPPGGLVKIGAAMVAPGGSVSNTGLALHKLGVSVRLVARIGDDLFGHDLARQFEIVGQGLSDHLRCVADEPTSYSIVISPPNSDRRFLHCPGANDSFSPEDVTDEALDGVTLLHLGYPPAMQAICDHDGAGLVELFERAQSRGILTSLDLCGIDANGWSGAIDWERLLKNVLPWTDLFLPSRDELSAMTPAAPEAVLSWGCRVLAIKDGEQGISVWTSDDAERIGPGWGGQTRQAPTFIVEVVGTTGAGDTTIAGFLAGLVNGESLDTTLDLACAAGAHCVGRADATSGLCDLDQLKTYLSMKAPRRTSP